MLVTFDGSLPTVPMGCRLLKFRLFGDAFLSSVDRMPQDTPPPHSETFAPTVSAETPDWTREARPRWWSPAQALLRSIRRYQACVPSRLGSLIQKRWVLSHRFWSVVTGADIPLNSQIAGGLLLPHPNGVVIHPKARIGPNCLFFQQVTVGQGTKPGYPQLGGHVDVGAGAKILGGVQIGDHAKIGANAVVLTDVPAGCTAVGIPAKIIRPTTSNTPT